MKDFQDNMNKSRDFSRWELWSNHRVAVKGLFEEIHSLKGKVNRIGIIGAGNCDDLDLEYISTICNEIYLFDIDLNSMEQASHKYPKEISEKLRLVQIDITTLDNTLFYDEYINLLSNKSKPEKIIDFLIKSANDLEVHGKIIKEFYNTCDIVATSAIYTQLIYNWGMMKLLEYEIYYTEKDIVTIIENGLVFLRNKLVVFYNELIQQFCTSTGAMIAWADMFEVYPEDYIRLKERGLQEISDLISVKGYPASIIGIKDLNSQLKSNSLNRTWIWDFDESKSYLCMGLSGLLK